MCKLVFLLLSSVFVQNIFALPVADDINQVKVIICIIDVITVDLMVIIIVMVIAKGIIKIFDIKLIDLSSSEM